MKDILLSPEVKELVKIAVTTAILAAFGYFKKKNDLKRLRKSGKLKD